MSQNRGDQDGYGPHYLFNDVEFCRDRYGPKRATPDAGVYAGSVTVADSSGVGGGVRAATSSGSDQRLRSAATTGQHVLIRDLVQDAREAVDNMRRAQTQIMTSNKPFLSLVCLSCGWRHNIEQPKLVPHHNHIPNVAHFEVPVEDTRCPHCYQTMC
jgi:hypothetical protein